MNRVLVIEGTGVVGLPGSLSIVGHGRASPRAGAQPGRS